MEELANIQSRLNRLNTDKLIDVVKNSKQYGYSEEITNYVLDLLKQRGITIEDLKLTGNLENDTYQTAERLFKSFKINSTAAFASYLFGGVTRFIIPHFFYNSDLVSTFFLILGIVGVVIFFFCLIKSFSTQSEFYKLTGDDYSAGAFIYFLVGLPLYFIMYFVFLNQMKEKMGAIS